MNLVFLQLPFGNRDHSLEALSMIRCVGRINKGLNPCLSSEPHRVLSSYLLNLVVNEPSSQGLGVRIELLYSHVRASYYPRRTEAARRLR